MGKLLPFKSPSAKEIALPEPQPQLLPFEAEETQMGEEADRFSPERIAKGLRSMFSQADIERMAAEFAGLGDPSDV